MCKTLGVPVVVSQGFADKFPDRFRSLGAHELRGVAEPLELYTLAEIEAG